MLALAVMWGLSIPITKLGLQTVPPLTLTAMRFAVAVPLLFVFTVSKQRLPLRALMRAAALGVLGIGVGQLAHALGVRDTSASVGTIISATIPVFVVIFAALRLKHPVTGRQQLGLLAAFAGIALVAFGHGQETTAVQDSSLGGAAWMLLSALTIAFYYVWSVELTREYGTTMVAAWSTLFGFVALLPGRDQSSRLGEGEPRTVADRQRPSREGLDRWRLLARRSRALLRLMVGRRAAEDRPSGERTEAFRADDGPFQREEGAQG